MSSRERKGCSPLGFLFRRQVRRPLTPVEANIVNRMAKAQGSPSTPSSGSHIDTHFNREVRYEMRGGELRAIDANTGQELDP